MSLPDKTRQARKKEKVRFHRKKTFSPARSFFLLALSLRMSRRGNQSARSVDEAEARLAHVHSMKCAERAKGPEESKKWPTEGCDISSRPIVSEVAIFINWHLLLGHSAESLTQIHRDTPDQGAMATGLAAWLQMVSHPLAGKVEAVATNDGHVEGKLSFNMTVGEHTETRSKVNIDVIALPLDASMPVSLDNLAGVIIRAMSVDWDHTFSDALRWTLIGNSRILATNVSRTNLGPGNAGRLAIRKAVEAVPPDSPLLEDFPETLFYDVVMRPDRYRPYMIEWAKHMRSAPAASRAYEAIRGEALRENAQQLARKRREVEAAGGDPMSVRDEFSGTEAEARLLLGEERIAALIRAAEAETRSDSKLPINILMNTLHMEAKTSAMRNNHADGIIASSLQVYNDAVTSRVSVRDPVTLSEQLDTLSYAVTGLSKMVSWAGTAFCMDRDLLSSALEMARKLDQSGFMHTAVLPVEVSPERLFTLDNALRMALEAGADASCCRLENYYGCRDEPLALGPIYDPAVRHDTVTFAPLGVVPRWGRTDEQIAELASDVVQSEASMAPWYGRVPDPANTRALPVGFANFEKLRQFRFWFAEDNIEEEVDRRLKQTTTVDDIRKRLAESVFVDLAQSGAASNEYNEQMDTTPSESLFVDPLRRLTAEDTSRLLSVESVGYGLGVNVTDAVSRARLSCLETARQRLRDTQKMPGVVEYTVEYGQSDQSANNHYQSNFTIASRRLEALNEKMMLLSNVDYLSYVELMPRFRDYCTRRFSHIYGRCSFNNGEAMNAVRRFDCQAWSNPDRICGSGAYQRVRPFTAALTHFGNRMAGDVITLSVVMNVTFCHAEMWLMLAVARALAFHNGLVKNHQLIHSKAGDGKSRMTDQVASLSIPQTFVQNMVTSTMAHVDAMASDDQIIIMDEAPKLFTNPDHTDPNEEKQNNIFRGIMSSGSISVARSMKGMWTETYMADHHVTLWMNANRVEPPENGERSMLSRIMIVRPMDMITQVSNFYRQHHVKAKTNTARLPVVRSLWQSTQALSAIMGKMISMFALPDADTTVVSCLLEHLASRIDLFYPTWLDSMRNSRRVATNVAGMAMFNAQAIVFNSDLSPFSPEHTAGMRNPGFDVSHMQRCAPFMYGTTEMMAVAMLKVFEQVVPTDLYPMMYALATSAGFSRASFEHLFEYGGRDFRASHSAHPGTFTAVYDINHGNVSEDVIKLALFAREITQFGSMRLQDRQARSVAVSARTDPEKGIVQINKFGEDIHKDLVAAMAFEEELLSWYQALPQSVLDEVEARSRLPEVPAADRPRKSLFKRGGFYPHEWGRTAEEMPEFWTVNNNLMLALEQRNRAYGAKGSDVVYFARRGNDAEQMGDAPASGYNPNYVRFAFSGNRDWSTAVEHALGAFSISRINFNYLMDHFARDGKAMLMMLPQLLASKDNQSRSVRWAVDKDGIIETKMTRIIVIPKSRGYIDISLVWLMLGGWHNHVMDMLSALDDKHVPLEGKNIITPFPSPRAPWLLQAFKLKRREGHAISVPNPAYVGINADTVVLDSLPSAANDESLFATLEQRHKDCARTAASSLAVRAAATAINIVTNSMASETAATATPQERRAQRRQAQYRELVKRLRSQYDHQVELHRLDPKKHAMPAPFVPPPQPRTAAEMRQTASDPAGFLAPDKRELIFDGKSVDSMLHSVFLYRTGQRLGIDWDDLESALAGDTELVHEALVRLNLRLDEKIAEQLELDSCKANTLSLDDAHKMDTMTEDELYGGEDDEDEADAGELSEFRPLDGAEAGQRPRLTPAEQARNRDQLISVADILRVHLSTQAETLHSYPGSYLPQECPQWMMVAERDARIRCEDLAKADRPLDLLAPPRLTARIQRGYEETHMETDKFVPWIAADQALLLPPPPPPPQAPQSKKRKPDAIAPPRSRVAVAPPVETRTTYGDDTNQDF